MFNNIEPIGEKNINGILLCEQNRNHYPRLSLFSFDSTEYCVTFNGRWIEYLPLRDQVQIPNVFI